MSAWTNWSGDQRCHPARIARPADEDTVREHVARAAGDGLAVRVAGAGHSFSPCVVTDGLLLDLGRLDRIVAADADSGLVTVEAGIRLHALAARLDALGLALENQGDIDTQALAGALATATHGTGARFGNLSSRVEAVRVVTADGAAHDLTAGDELRAGRVALGVLGVVTRVTLRCVPLFTVHRRDAPRPRAEVLATLDEQADAHDHFETFLFPYARRALTRTSRREPAAPGRPTPAWKRRLREDLLENGALGAACALGRRSPRLVPALNRLLTAGSTPAETVDRGHRVYPTPRRVRFVEMEYAIPREHARAAVERVLAVIERRRLPVAFPLEVRWAAADDALLSTAHGRATAYVAVHQARGLPVEPAFGLVEAIMGEYGGRPHWGKRHGIGHEQLRERYPGWDRFAAVRERLDPDGVFLNGWAERALGVQRKALPSPR